VGGQPEALGDAGGHARPEVAQDTVEVETDQHEVEVTQGL
jgi:hypothetical protein